MEAELWTLVTSKPHCVARSERNSSRGSPQRTQGSQVGAESSNTRLSAVMPKVRHRACAKRASCAWDATTPFGRPVLPDVRGSDTAVPGSHELLQGVVTALESRYRWAQEAQEPQVQAASSEDTDTTAISATAAA